MSSIDDKKKHSRWCLTN